MSGSGEESESGEAEGRGVRIVLVALPVCLALSTVGAVWFHWQQETREVADPGLAMMGTGIERAEVEDSLKKLSNYIGPRGWETPEERHHVRQVIAFLEGSLSPQNYGFVVQRGAEVSYAEELWPMLWVDVPGRRQAEDLIVLAAAYDGDLESLVALMTAARELRGGQVRRTIRFLLYPERVPGVSELRSEFLESGERVVAMLSLRMGSGREGEGASRLEVVGPELGELEAVLPGTPVQRVIRAPGAVSPRGAVGLMEAEVYQHVGPIGALDGEERSETDVAALMAQTRTLVGLLRALAGGEGE